MSRQPTLSEVIRDAVDVGAKRLRVAMPGRVESFDAAKQTANIKPLLKESFVDVADVERVESVPVVNAVPCVFLKGYTVPVAAGDECLLIFCDRSIDVWHANGGEVDPNDARRHSVTDAIAIMGLRSAPDALTEFDTARVVVGLQGSPRVSAGASDIRLGGSHNETLTEGVIKGTSYRSAESTKHSSESAALAAAVTAAAGVASALATAAIGPGAAVPVTNGTLASSMAPLATALATLAGALQSAISAFESATASSVSTIVKVK